MCSILILFRPRHEWPILIAANRDELDARPSRSPARHWPDRPEVVAGLDLEAGGSWLGLNDHGVVAAITNRAGTLGGQPGKRSRGELVLEALDHAEAEQAARSLAELHPRAYRPFNLIVADPCSAHWIRLADRDRIRVTPIEPGLHMLTDTDLDDPAHPRIATYLPRFAAAAIPDPSRGDWSDWQRLLASRDHPAGSDADAAMLQERADGFRTRSSALIALPAFPGFSGRPLWLHADCQPDPETYRPIL